MINKGIQFLPGGFLLSRGSVHDEAEGGQTSSSPVQAPVSDEDQVKLDKSNIILFGPTGCGEWGRLFFD